MEAGSMLGKGDGLVCGIDEAGRGPIIGPMVMAGVLMHERNLIHLLELGVKDSKLLSKAKREEFFEQIIEMAKDYRIKTVVPEEIDTALRSASSNLNWLEADTSATMVNELKPGKVIVDCPSINVPAYKDYFVGKLNNKMKANAEVVVEHKADLNHVVVAAASILAKVTRDREVERLKQKHGHDFGSGYLTDEKTQQFLKKNFDKKKHCGLFRKSWKPYQELVAGKSQTKLGGF